jgi:hypothetical protein
MSNDPDIFDRVKKLENMVAELQTGKAVPAAECCPPEANYFHHGPAVYARKAFEGLVPHPDRLVCMCVDARWAHGVARALDRDSRTAH